MTPRKYLLLAAYKLNDLYISVEADKNLGLCVLERDYYIKRCISEHLGNSTNYKLISKAEASTIQSLLSRQFGSWLGKHADQIPEHEREYLRQARNKHPNKLSRFRATVKIHKTPDWHSKKQELRFRPIVACCGTWINCWSK